MSEFKKIFVGQRVQSFPARSYEKLLRGEERDRTQRLLAEMRRGGAPVHEVVLLETIPAASWVPATRKLTPTAYDAPLWVPHEADDGSYTWHDEITLRVLNFYKTAITVAANKAKVALVVGTRLFNVDCEELDLPEEE